MKEIFKIKWIRRKFISHFGQGKRRKLRERSSTFSLVFLADQEESAFPCREFPVETGEFQGNVWLHFEPREAAIF